MFSLQDKLIGFQLHYLAVKLPKSLWKPGFWPLLGRGRGTLCCFKTRFNTPVFSAELETRESCRQRMPWAGVCAKHRTFFLLQEKTNKQTKKKGFFFFLWAGESLRQIELHAWECLLCLLREAGCVLQFHRWLSLIHGGFSSPLQGANPGRAGGENCAQL